MAKTKTLTEAEKLAAKEAKAVAARQKAVQGQAEATAKASAEMEAENKKRQADEKAEAAKAAAKVDATAKKAREDLAKRPLNDNEQLRLAELEELAQCKERNPFPTEMLELSRLRARAKLAIK